MESYREESQQDARGDEVGDLQGAVGTQGEPARPGTGGICEGVPADPDHEVVLERGQQSEEGAEEYGPDHPGEGGCRDDRPPLRLDPPEKICPCPAASRRERRVAACSINTS